MENIEILNKILSIAKQLSDENSTYSRADLASDLKELGVNADGIEISKLVWDAYNYFDKNKSIFDAFIGNAGRRSVVDDYRVADAMNGKDADKVMDLVQKDMSYTEGALEILHGRIQDSTNYDTVNMTSDLVDYVMGTTGVKQVREQAMRMYKYYSALIDAYGDVKAGVMTDVNDFVVIRTDVKNVFMKYALALEDIFGENIKVVAPELFDFNSIEWLNTEDMLKQMDLAFNKVADACSVLMGEIADSFQASLTASLSDYKLASRNSKSVGLAMAGLAMVNHYIQAARKTGRLKTELTKLSVYIRKDVTQIKGDAGRLTVIHQLINNVFLPKARAFDRFSRKVLSEDLDRLLESYYSSQEAKALRLERESLLEECHTLEKEINDHEANIVLYRALIKDAESVLLSKKAMYDESISKKPVRPSFLYNIISFGVATKDYNRDVYEWNENCGPLVKEYENLQVETQLNREELTCHEEALKVKDSKIRELRSKCKDINIRIRNSVVSDDSLRMQILQHLSSIIGVLKVGKDIAQMRLDDELVKVVDIPSPESIVELPESWKEQLDRFIKKMKEDVGSDNNSTELVKDGEEYKKPVTVGKDEDCLNERYEKIVKDGVLLFDTCLNLQVQRTRDMISSAVYDQQFRELQKDFARRMKDVDDQSAYLREVIRRMNVATDTVSVRDCIMRLSDNKMILSDSDFEDFLRGKKSIEL
ncbi:MAG: coiled-coil domain-containing protein 22 [Bacteroidaceae bacterium]|nr:coiled-coil domain-containing protein 22 [Bacteroidaceae bacterium]